MTSRPSIGVFSLATNRYADYWMAMARTADANLFTGHEVVMTVFTDRAADVRAFESELERVRVNPIQITSLRWPDATLDKFQTLSEHRAEVAQDVVMHLDADMLIEPGAGDDLKPADWAGGIALVRHPGYRRPRGAAQATLYVRHPGYLARDVYRQFTFGGRGTWCTDERSTAFVPRDRRRTYVCGGTWMGRRGELLELCEVLAEHTNADRANGVMAIFHDESHLNWFAANRQCEILDSDYCYVEGGANLTDLTPRIIAVEKHDDRTR